MVIWESSQWLGKNIVQSNGNKKSRKAQVGALATAIKLEITYENGVKPLNNQTNNPMFSKGSFPRVFRTPNCAAKGFKPCQN